MNSSWFYLVIAAVLCANWPNVAKFAHLNAVWISFLFALGTGIIAIFGIALNPTLPPMKSIGIGTIAGAVNGLGLLGLGVLLARQEEVSRILPIFLGLMTVFSVISAFVFFGDPLTLKRMVGVLIVALGIYIIS